MKILKNNKIYTGITIRTDVTSAIGSVVLLSSTVKPAEFFMRGVTILRYTTLKR